MDDRLMGPRGASVPPRGQNGGVVDQPFVAPGIPRRLLQTVAALVRAVNDHHWSTGDHARRVTGYTLLLAGEIGLGSSDRLVLEIGAILHDVGKIAVAEAILCKPGVLTASERKQVEAHPVQGYHLLRTLPELTPILPIVRSHHERWDGCGYPDRLAGTAIPSLARIVAVADAFDAMTSDRPYRPALAMDVALAQIAAGASHQFDPCLAAAFLRLRPRLEQRAA